jgi:hypothetical protein
MASKVTTASTGTIGLEMTLRIVSGPSKGKVFTETLWKTPKGYHRFREVLAASGKRAPARVDMRKIAQVIKGSVFFVELEDEEDESGKYKTRSRVTFQDGFLSLDKAEEDGDDEDEDNDDDLDDEEGEDDDLDDEDEDEDDDEEEDEDDDEEEEEPAPRRRKPAATRRAPAKKAAPARRRKKPADDDEDEDDDLSSISLEDF